MPQFQNDPEPFYSEANVLRHEVMSLVALLAHDQFLDADARDRARDELTAALARLEKLVQPDT